MVVGDEGARLVREVSHRGVEGEFAMETILDVRVLHHARVLRVVGAGGDGRAHGVERGALAADA